MTPLDRLGYSKPQATAERTAICLATMAASSLIAKIFVFSISFKSHLTFGTIAGMTGTLLRENDHPKKWMTQTDEKKQKIAAVVLIGVSLFSARAITSWIFERVSYKSMVGRGVYLTGAGTLTAYAYVLYRRRQQKLSGS